VSEATTSGWICKRCETANVAGSSVCDVCDSPLLYTQEELERVVKQLVEEAAARIKAELAPMPVPVPAPSITTTNCDDAWILAFILGLVALGLFIFIVLLFTAS
jgi:hypothetical protein